MADKLSDDLGRILGADTARIRESIQALKNFSSTDEGRALLRSVGQQTGEKAKDAAEKMKRGDLSAAKSLVEEMQRSESGRALTEQIRRIAGNQVDHP